MIFWEFLAKEMVKSMKNRAILRMTAAFLILFICSSCLFGCGKKKRVTKETEDTTYGIDVARYQGTIDWNEVAQSGVDFAMIRVGYRGQTDGIIKEDPNGRYNLQEASKAGIKIGAYFFSTAVSGKRRSGVDGGDSGKISHHISCGL